LITISWTEDWQWGLPFVALTMVFHAFGLVMIGVVLAGFQAVHRRHASLPQLVVGSTLVIALVGMLLAAMHGLEAGFWAILYVKGGAFQHMHEAMFYSLDSMTARGASGLELPAEWRLLGAIEAVNGVLLFGASAAFLFTIMQGAWHLIGEAVRNIAARKKHRAG
jgi:hypothetical protein